MTSVISFVWTGPLPSNEEVIELSAKLEAVGGGMRNIIMGYRYKILD